MQVTCRFVMFVSPIGGVFLRYYNPTTTYCSWICGLSRFSMCKVKTYEYFPFYSLIFIAIEVRLLRQFSSFTLLMVDKGVSLIYCSFMILFSNDRFGCVIWTACWVFCDKNGFNNYRCPKRTIHHQVHIHVLDSFVGCKLWAVDLKPTKLSCEYQAVDRILFLV